MILDLLFAILTVGIAILLAALLVGLVQPKVGGMPGDGLPGDAVNPSEYYASDDNY